MGTYTPKKTPACRQCRQRKIGCDRNVPMCGNCVKRNLPECTYPERKVGSGRPRSSTSTTTRMSKDRNISIRNQTMSRGGLFNEPLAMDPNKLNNILPNNGYQFRQYSGPGNGAGTFNVPPPTMINDPNSTMFNNQNLNFGNNLPTYINANMNNSPYTRTTLTNNNNINMVNVPNPNTYTNANAAVASAFDANSALNKFQRDKEEEREVDEVQFNTKSNQISANNKDNEKEDSGIVGSRVQLLNANLSAIPNLFDPTDISGIYKAKELDQAKHKKQNHTGKKTGEEDDEQIILTQPASVFYDLLTSTHSQEEILLKEMDFLKDRYLQLQHYKSRYFDTEKDKETSGIDLLSQLFNGKRELTDSDSNNNNNKDDSTNKKRKKSTDGSKKKNDPHVLSNGMNDNEIPFLLINPKVLEMNINKKDLNQAIPNIHNYLTLTPVSMNINRMIPDFTNCKFHINSVILNDGFLLDFYKKLLNVFIINFGAVLGQYYNDKFKFRSQTNEMVSNDSNHIIILKTDLMIEILKINSKTIPKLNEFFKPLLDSKLDGLVNDAERLLKNTKAIDNDVAQLDITSTSLNDTSSIGIMIIMILFFYYSNQYSSEYQSSKLMSIIKLRLHSINHSISVLKTKIINNTKNIDDNNTTRNILQFLTFTDILKQIEYETIDENDSIDLNESMVFALERSINRESSLLSQWQYISKNYLEKNIFDGKGCELLIDKIVPEYVTKPHDEIKSSHIQDNNHVNDLNNEFNFNVSQWKIVIHLNSCLKNKSIGNMRNLLNDMDQRYDQLMNVTNHDDDFLLDYKFKSFMKLNGSINYYRLKLFIEYKIFLQWEIFKDVDQVRLQFDNLFTKVLVPSLLMIFPKRDKESLSSEDHSNKYEFQYEFLFIKRKMMLLEDTLEILFAIFQRFENFYDCQINKMDAVTQHDKDIISTLTTLIRHFRSLFIILFVILTNISRDEYPHIKNFKPLQKMYIMLSHMAQNESIRTELFQETLKKDPMTGMVIYSNNVHEDKYGQLSRQEYLLNAQRWNNGLSFIGSDKLLRYGKLLNQLNARLMEKNNINHHIDLQMWFDTNIVGRNGSNTLVDYNITPSNCLEVYKTFFHCD